MQESQAERIFAGKSIISEAKNSFGCIADLFMYSFFANDIKTLKNAQRIFNFSNFAFGSI